MINLDFDLLPTILGHKVFMGLPHFVEEPLSRLQLPETFDRLRAASLLLAQTSSTNQQWLNRAYLRAGLSEFRSVDQALHWDLGRRDVYTPAQSSNPLVHLIYRLRRISVYVAGTSLAEKQVNATLKFRDTETTAEIEVVLLENLEEYLRNEKLTDYNSDDIARICRWFDEHQQLYGAPQMLEIGVAVFAQELCEVYAARSATA